MRNTQKYRRKTSTSATWRDDLAAGLCALGLGMLFMWMFMEATGQ